ncbi:MAG: iron-sulfur cluster repair di-iron protein [Flavobacteriales bacterium]|nr:iron-sulfur cluster repair di-iron protein [Flavobacteriales bacterium]
MNISKETIIGELVAQDYRTASVFKKNGIDFCCNGNRSIAEACNQKQLNAENIIQTIKEIIGNTNGGSVDFNSWPLDLLADYIEKKHHRYVEEKTVEIKPYLDKICKVHGAQHPELFEINDHFIASTSELSMHMKKEELILFPFIKKMAKAQQEKTVVERPGFESVQNPIQAMMDDHTTEGDRFREIEKLSNNYNPPADACNTYRVTFALLKEFEQDLHLHIHLENNILFPKAIELEKVML